ncbi:hypothetical protein [Geopsychrobacter electrodiphilus]|uniref:hypothetical protein n=1 Tax=Geopsychrobacter electrodiphilus TaxID=225196 RepID=UPI00037BC98E|nr:hypothetical protein [Geopsychrobacter electrodiphilus]
MIFQNKKLNHLLLGSLIVALALPLINIILIYPHFSDLLVSNVEESAIRFAQHIERDLLDNGNWSFSLSSEEPTSKGKDLIASYMADFGLRKIKMFSEKGMTIFSTDTSDIGKLNDHAYFHESVAKGQLFSKVVKKKSKSLEGQTYQDDVVEVYVPSMADNKFSGAFELYYNITPQMTHLDLLIWFASILPFAVSGILLLALYWGIRNLDKSMIAKAKAEAEIKVLQGIIPICSYCKEIRDDQGYWNKLENFIAEHSEAEFSHGICDKCIQVHYGEEMAKKVLSKRSQK